ncbi:MULTISPECIES: MetQ/NlpA family ABC transporter substrate-binding protein [Lacticaseibacillus]|uniref:Lipoprotein n=2 Tax=Lacticaseibacillus TaxID=2759736 RepID=A0AAN1C8T5_LACCA|nr:MULTISPECIES: MetQ/NlpA family ABC transporter substrate-binding protein [Lacticaseibacillus]ARY91293.1 metal ABC transporter substrate-binding protein [Lacticaseibacillus casei]KAB1968392.1 MetQ/NlpA family ABC transporter substrate-binding protein [Lacticaseibacillus casei]WLV81911.1 MetQ/NlpA family ABC transporter substrate-binding protein [Lacticaseibacillus sp. NCIMB 15473]WNX25817.1 MetQ/NlpA family ABC transporter substrate-binding protein [Lacticaseibacillus casei]WNX28590.1 MetQ/N
MKRFWKIFATIAVLGLILVGCGNSSSSSQKQTTVKIGVVGADNRVLQSVAKKVKKQGINIKIVQFSDYNQPNTALKDHDIDLNLFQHQYFLNNWNKTHHGDLVSIGQTIIAPLAIYSKKITKISQIKQGDTIALPNDPTNEGRALQLLQAAGLIKLNTKVALPTTRDVTANKLNLKLKAVDAAQTASSLPDVAASVINSGVAQDAKLNPKKAIYTEKVNKQSQPWINVFVANKKDKNNKTYQKIVKAFRTKDTANLIEKLYHGSEVPAWTQKF